MGALFFAELERKQFAQDERILGRKNRIADSLRIAEECRDKDAVKAFERREARLAPVRALFAPVARRANRAAQRVYPKRAAVAAQHALAQVRLSRARKKKNALVVPTETTGNHTTLVTVKARDDDDADSTRNVRFRDDDHVSDDTSLETLPPPPEHGESDLVTASPDLVTVSSDPATAPPLSPQQPVACPAGLGASTCASDLS